MLSRTADHLFWMARYMERAENTARMLDINWQTSLLPQSANRTEQGWREHRITQQQTRPRHWRERRGNLQLGIITPARALKRVGPVMVEHIFALTVRF